VFGLHQTRTKRSDCIRIHDYIPPSVIEQPARVLEVGVSILDFSIAVGLIAGSYVFWKN